MLSKISISKWNLWEKHSLAVFICQGKKKIVEQRGQGVYPSPQDVKICQVHFLFLIWWTKLIDFQTLNQLCTPRINLIWPWWTVLVMYCWTWAAKCLGWTFVSTSCPSLVLALGQRWLIKPAQRCPLPPCKWAVVDCVSFLPRLLEVTSEPTQACPLFVTSS